jgi:hypothetical protein
MSPLRNRLFEVRATHAACRGLISRTHSRASVSNSCSRSAGEAQPSRPRGSPDRFDRVDLAIRADAHGRLCRRFNPSFAEPGIPRGRSRAVRPLRSFHASTWRKPVSVCAAAWARDSVSQTAQPVWRRCVHVVGGGELDRCCPLHRRRSRATARVTWREDRRRGSGTRLGIHSRDSWMDAFRSDDWIVDASCRSPDDDRLGHLGRPVPRAEWNREGPCRTWRSPVEPVAAAAAAST